MKAKVKIQKMRIMKVIRLNKLEEVNVNYLNRVEEDMKFWIVELEGEKVKVNELLQAIKESGYEHEIIEEEKEEVETVKFYHGTTCGQDLSYTGFEKVEASNEDEEVFEQGIWLTTSLKSAAWYAAGTRRSEEGEVWTIELPRNFPGLELVATEEEATNEIGVGDEWVVEWENAKGLKPEYVGQGWEIWDRLEEEEEQI